MRKRCQEPFRGTSGLTRFLVHPVYRFGLTGLQRDSRHPFPRVALPSLISTSR
jgi:hypothetical protein